MHPLPGDIATSVIDTSLIHADEYSIADGDIHLWHFSLDHPGCPLDALQRHLSADERARAARYVFDHDRDRWVAARGMLRLILSRYLHTPPAGVRFDYSPHGKPLLTGSDDLAFNLSHSHQRALLAIARSRKVGVDIEYVRPQVDIHDIAQSVFSEAERFSLANLPAAAQRRAFYACWTRKEAYIKARGEGLSYPLENFAVSLAPDLPPAILWSAEGEAEASRWQFASIDEVPGYATAVIVEAPLERIHIARSG